MFSNKKSIQNIENELLDNSMTSTSSLLIHKTVKTEELNISHEVDTDSIYEFTFDPNEEPPPPSKQTAPKKKAKPKPKVIFVNNNYETNVLKTLQTLKKSIKMNSLDADDKENLCIESPGPVEKNNDVKKSLSPVLRNVSPNGNKNILKNESPNLLKEILFENTPKATPSKHPKASPWRAEFVENPQESRETFKFTPKSKFANLQEHTAVVENTEPKLKQPRLLDFIKQSSEKSTKLQNNAIDESPRSNKSETVTECRKFSDENELNKNQEKDGPVNLFEELEVIAPVKPCRRSYGKKETASPSLADRAHASASDIMNFSEELSAISTCNKKAVLKQDKKQEHKTQLTRQEEEEVNAWAEAFNSMCEDVDDFPLVVE